MKRSIRSSIRGETFVDTSGFYALLVKKERAHKRARQILRETARRKRSFVTTDYVLDETATLLKARRIGHLVADLFGIVFASTACKVEWMDPERFEQTREFFVKHEDQDWSFTDCFSFCVMHELRLGDALTTDRHFRQAGFNPLLV